MRKRVLFSIVIVFAALAIVPVASADELNSGDIAWVATASALVMLMTPALGFFYAGLVRRKNLVSTLFQCLAIFAVVSIAWTLWGYSLVFGPSLHGIIGDLSHFGLRGVGATPDNDYAPTIPALLLYFFQLKFAAITPALIIGAIAERINFRSLLIFSLLWATLVYAPVAHWIWNVNGWLHNLGTWFGWFGFNGRSSLASNTVAVTALVVTKLAGATAGLGWMVIDWYLKGKPSSVGLSIGAVCGLAAVTPASGYIGPVSAIIIGLVVGVLSNLVANWRTTRTKLDDSLDVFACHGVGGIWGSLATGLFASVAINSAGRNGLFFGNPKQFLVQLLAVAVVVVYAFAGSYLLLKLINIFSRIRVSPEDEELGLDTSLHGETAYDNSDF